MPEARPRWRGRVPSALVRKSSGRQEPGLRRWRALRDASPYAYILPKGTRIRRDIVDLLGSRLQILTGETAPRPVDSPCAPGFYPASETDVTLVCRLERLRLQRTVHEREPDDHAADGPR